MIAARPSRRLRRLSVALVTGLAASWLAPVPAAASHSPAAEVVHVFDDRDGFDSVQGTSVVLRNIATGRVRTLLPASPEDHWQDADPGLSHDSEFVVLSTERGSDEYIRGIGRVSRTGSGFTRLTEPGAGAVDVSPKVSPDGAQVLFVRFDLVTETGSLHTVPLSGGAVSSPLPVQGSVQSADWSPTGDHLVYASYPTPADIKADIFIFDRASDTSTDTGRDGEDPSWAPDGSWIAFTSFAEDGSSTIKMMWPFVHESWGARLLTDDQEGSSWSPSWLPDGRSLVYSRVAHSDPTSTADLWTADVEYGRDGPLVATPDDEYGGSASGVAPTSVVRGAASRFTALPTPGRLVDTRSGLGAPKAKLAGGGTLPVQVTGSALAVAGGGQVSVPTDATAVVLNVTAVKPSGQTYLTLWPSGRTRPTSSNLNAAAGEVVPNAVTVGTGTGGKVSLYNYAGATDVLVDIVGYYGPAGDGFAGGNEPKRIMDTRKAGYAGHGTGPVSGTRDLTVVGDVPVQGGEFGLAYIPLTATAVVLNVTATRVSTDSGDVRVYPTPSDNTFPAVSNLNVVRGQTVANLVTVRVGQGGKVRFRTSSGSMDLIADLAGYYLPGDDGGVFVPVVPTRFIDSRNGTGTAPTKLAGGDVAVSRITGVRGVPRGACSAVLNMTVTSVGDAGSTDVRVYPVPPGSGDDLAVPTVSNLNVTPGVTRANMAVVSTCAAGSDGRIAVRNAHGTLHAIADLAGYFIPAYLADLP